MRNLTAADLFSDSELRIFDLAGVAQLDEQWSSNPQEAGSNPAASPNLQRAVSPTSAAATNNNGSLRNTRVCDAADKSVEYLAEDEGAGCDEHIQAQERD
jgi:hypothetical protein